MTLNRACLLAVVIGLAPAGAMAQDGKPSKKTEVAVTVGSDVSAPSTVEDLIPRRTYQKRAYVTKPAGTSRLAVKFRDDVKARPMADKTLSFQNANDAVDTTTVQQIATSFNLQFVPAFGSVPQEKLEHLQTLAMSRSGKSQPDLGGVMFIDGPADTLQAAANMLNQLDAVEVIFFLEEWRPFPQRDATPPRNGPSNVAGPATGACCVSTSGCTVVSELDCTLAGGTYLGDNTTCAPGNPCLAPGACCLPGDCVQSLPFTCEISLGGSYAGAGTNCADDPCPPPPPDPRACCLPDTTCGVMLPDDCLAQGGIVQGEGVVCADNPCTTPGACCLDGEDCFISNQLKCVTAGGTFMGVGSNCDPSPCAGAAVGGCCLPDQTCQELAQQACVDAGGTFLGAGIACGPASCDDPPPPPDLIACCIYPDICLPLSADDCTDLGGIVRAGTCEDEECEMDCGTEDLPSCFEEHIQPFCVDPECCNLVGEFREFCVSDADPQGSWDFVCVAIAHTVCAAPPADRCLSPFGEGCFVPHGSAGCQPTDCCYAVCSVDPFCCTNQWDLNCVEIALQLCPNPNAGATPNFVGWQGYLRESAYGNQFGGPPINPFAMQLPPDPLPPPADNPFIWPNGFFGEGYNLFAEGPSLGNPVRLQDDPNMPAPQRYQGLYGLGRELHERYGIGEFNGARGRGVKAAVIEWGWWHQHEDLTHVQNEPGQTIITIPTMTFPDHATACLGIIGAANNGIGVVGIAPDAELLFFPMVSVEEGPRTFAAFANCFLTLGPGDVVSCSFGGGGNLNTNEFSHMLLTMGSDLGICMVVAAGNACLNLDDEADLGDSGAIVVGASYPGAPHCRIPFSNYFRSAGEASSSRVHCNAWGSLVTSTGGGDLWIANGNPNRSYTFTFNGTSAAAPQIAGLIACFQGIAKQFFGIPLTPSQIRTFLMAEGQYDNLCQCGVCNPGDLPGFPEEAGCGPDSDPDNPGNQVGPYTRPMFAASRLLGSTPSGFDQSPQVKDVYVIRGDSTIGNVFSVKASDNAYLLVRSLYTYQNHQPILNSNNPEANAVASKARYYSTGYVADVMVRGIGPQNAKGGVGVSIVTEVNHPDPMALLFVEAFDWTTGRWSFINVNVVPPTPVGGEVALANAVLNGGRFVHPTTRSMYIRAYLATSGPEPDISSEPGGGPGYSPSTVRFDWISVSTTPGGSLPVP